MVLATIIRLEMAYPGVGILAGDSLQYLSVVTAHAVIMVFFMIMPLLFGAFGNFLLPTQLGVHDVAFPRLNSAAFWFLPAGLLMLVQLVCLDRRYQRMNCYNIREIQTILKSKYAPATSDSADVHFNLNDTAIGLRYQIGGLDFIDPSMLTFYKNALTNNPRYRALHEFLHKPIVEFDAVKLFMSRTSLMFSVLRTMYEDESCDVRYLAIATPNSLHSDASILGSSVIPSTSLGSTASFNGGFSITGVTSNLNVSTFTGAFGNLTTSVLNGYLSSLYSAILALVSGVLSSLTSPLYYVVNFPGVVSGLVARVSYAAQASAVSLPSVLLFDNFSILYNSIFSAYAAKSASSTLSSESAITDSTYSVVSSDSQSVLEYSTSALSERTDDQRFMRFMNPVFKYDFKVGNYLPDDAKKLNPHLFATIKDITTGIRKSS